jgi:ribosomal protein S6
MPLYELLCLAQPALPRENVVRMIQRVATVLYTNGGVITDLQSYGDQQLAYKIKGTRGKYEQVSCWHPPAERGCCRSLTTLRDASAGQHLASEFCGGAESA